ncbi:MAG TPA: thioredoxin family protein [Blastocatellia bacterium]|nr:thioredoxin family protein [Blastocatellia bacterium]
MNRLLVTLVLLLALASMATAQAKKTASADWHDVTRDVFVNNELDRNAQVLTADNPPRLALISSKLDMAIVLDVTDKTMSAMAKDAFHFAADRTAARSDAGIEMQPLGKFTRIDGPVYSFAVGGQPVLIRAHPGAVGALTFDKLWETVPVWRAEMDAYTPDARAVAALKSVDKDTQLTLIFGTWCGDSKYYVPRLLRALKEAGNPHLQVNLIGIDNQFHEPVATVQPRQLTNVPTIIVERDGREIGRIVETPAVDSIEQDLADLLNGKPNPHKGRWERGAKVASGTYQYKDAGGHPLGSEDWELFNAADGGMFIHSRVAMGDTITEVFERTNAQHVPTFVEITHQRSDARARTRINIDGHTLTARLRGSTAGIIQQTLELPDAFNIDSPSVAADSLRLAEVKSSEATRWACYVTPAGFNGTMGALVTMSVESKGDEAVRVPAGEFRARHVIGKTDKGASQLWLHPQLGVPVRGEAGGVAFVLTALEITPAAK